MLRIPVLIRGFLVLLCMFLSLSCEDLLEEPDISTQSVVLVSPADSATVAINALSFDWEDLADARSFRIQIGTPNFENPLQIVLDSTLQRDSLDRIITRIQWNLENGNYAWRVKALNGGFETPYSVRAFTVDGDADADFDPPNTPSLLSPADTSSQADTSVSFSWSRADLPGTAEFDSIYIYEDATLSTLNHKALGANKTYTHSLSSGSTYYWQVRGFDQAGNRSELSETFSFTLN